MSPLLRLHVAWGLQETETRLYNHKGNVTAGGTGPTDQRTAGEHLKMQQHRLHSANSVQLRYDFHLPLMTSEVKRHHRRVEKGLGVNSLFRNILKQERGGIGEVTKFAESQ